MKIIKICKNYYSAHNTCAGEWKKGLNVILGKTMWDRIKKPVWLGNSRRDSMLDRNNIF